MTEAPATLDELHLRWDLAPDGVPFATASSLLQFVRAPDGTPAVLKLARSDEEARGGRALAAWTGSGAAPVLRSDGPALLVVRATGPDAAALHRAGDGDAALDQIAAVATALHAGDVPSDDVPEGDVREDACVPLDRWFATLARLAERRGGAWARAWDDARTLLVTPSDVVPLHGDLHHGNVLDFGAAGWRAIDPKALRGDPAFDLAAPLLNPDRQRPHGDPVTMLARARRLADATGHDLDRVLAWTEAFAWLSAAWNVEDGTDPSADLAWRAVIRAARAAI